MSDMAWQNLLHLCLFRLWISFWNFVELDALSQICGKVQVKRGVYKEKDGECLTILDSWCTHCQ